MATAPSVTYRVASGASVNAGRFAGGRFAGAFAFGDASLSGGFEAAAAPLALTQVVAAPQFWTQFSRPQAVRSGDFVYLGHTNMAGDTLISQYNIASGATTTFTLGTGTGPNGHDSCVIGIRPDGRIIAVWAVQNNDAFRRISTNPHDITAFGPALELSGIAVVSYSSLFHLSVPNRWYVHYRQGNGGGPGDRPCVGLSSDDNMDTRNTGEFWITQAGERPYVISCNNGSNRVDFFCTNKHQVDSGPDSFFNLYHCYAVFQADGSKTFYKSDGTTIGASVTQLSDQATLVYAGATGGPGWNYDIAYGSDGNPRVLFVRQQADDDHRHMFARWTGSSWATTEIGASGQRLYSSEIWSDGALTFDGLGTDCVVRALWVGSAVECQDWRTTDNGATWSKYADITSGSAAGRKTMTPIKVTNADSRVSRAMKIGTVANWSDFNLAINLMGKG